MKKILIGLLVLGSVSTYACDNDSMNEADELYQTVSRQEAGSLDVFLAKKHLLDVTLCAQGTSTHEYCKVAVDIQSKIKNISSAKFKSGVGSINDYISAMNELNRVKEICK